MANKSIGKIISTLRKERGMTQKELADNLNITDKAVSKWERDIGCLINVIFKAITIAMGIAVVVTSMLGQLNIKSGFTMLGIGLACVGIYLLKSKD